jgi:5-methylcytosine-specific restriction endonuclease McrA
MAFSEETKQAALIQAGYQCECRRSNCSEKHRGRCPTILLPGNWHAHHKTAELFGGPDTLNNCEALCIPCHKSTRTYGAS